MKTYLRLLVSVGVLMVVPCAGNAQESKLEQVKQREAERQASRMARRMEYWSKESLPDMTIWIEKYDNLNVNPPSDAKERIEEGAERATKRLNGADSSSNFGFTDKNTRITDDVWFYDYYNYWPTYFSVADETATSYVAAVRYFDLDNDGVYETSASYRDSDQDGSFDEFDRYDFAATENDNLVNELPSDAKRYTVSGKIRSKRTTAVNNSDHVIVRVALDDLESVIVDLGHESLWTDVDFSAGNLIKATGPMQRIGEKNVLLAEEVTIGDKPTKTGPAVPKYTGTILDVKEFNVNKVLHTFAIVETTDGNRIVDLGPTEELKADVVVQEEIAVYGTPVRMNDRQVVMASRLEIDGKTFMVERWK